MQLNPTTPFDRNGADSDEFLEWPIDGVRGPLPQPWGPWAS